MHPRDSAPVLVIVKGQSWGDGRDTMLASRAFEYTEKSLVDRFKPGGQLDLVEIFALIRESRSRPLFGRLPRPDFAMLSVIREKYRNNFRII